MRNTGIDLTLGVDIFKDTPFTWNLTLLGSTIKNKVCSWQINRKSFPDLISFAKVRLIFILYSNCRWR